jgi:hypothetical protein
MYHLPTQCFMRLQQAATTSSPNNINRLVCVTKTYCVFCEVATTRCTLFKVQAAAHTLGKHQEYKFPWFSSVLKSLLDRSRVPSCCRKLLSCCPSQLKHIKLTPMLKSTTLSCLALGRKPKSRGPHFEQPNVNSYCFCQKVERAKGQNLLTKWTPPHKVPVLWPLFLLSLPFKSHRMTARLTLWGWKLLLLRTSINWEAQLTKAKLQLPSYLVTGLQRLSQPQELYQTRINQISTTVNRRRSVYQYKQLYTACSLHPLCIIKTVTTACTTS